MPESRATGGAGTNVFPQNIPVTSVSSLLLKRSGAAGETLVHLRGTVIDQRPGDYIVIADSTGSIVAESSQILGVNALGQVDLWGRPAWDGTRVRLTAASFRPVNSAQDSWTNVAPEAGKPAALPVLTNALQIRDLSPARAAWHYPVHIQAVVTFFQPAHGNKFYVQDDTSGIYVRPTMKLNLNPGDLIEIEGMSDPGGFAPIIIPSNVVVLGSAPLPAPDHATPYQLATGQYNSQWMEVRGVVHSQNYNDGLLQLKLADSSGIYLVHIVTSTTPTNLLGSVVRVQGVCSTQFNDRRQITDSAVWVPSPAFVEIETPAESDPFSLPEQSILSLSQFRPKESLPGRVKVVGTVTLRQQQEFYLQDTNYAVHVLGVQTNDFEEGDRVMAAGYPALEDYGPVLQDAVFRKMGHETAPHPKPVPPDGSLDTELQCMWAQAEGRLANCEQIGEMLEMTLQLPNALFEADCPVSPGEHGSTPPIGSLLRVTGVYRVRVNAARVPTSFQLLVPSLDNIQLLQRPSWWTLKHTVAVIGIMTIIAAGSALWVVMLRRKVRDQTMTLRQSENKFRSLVEESLVGVYIIQSNRFAYVNPRMAEIFGYSVAEFSQLPSIQEAIFEPDRSLVMEQMRRRIAEEIQTAHYTFRGLRKDGSLVYVEVLGSRTEYEGKPAVLGTLLDVTERKRAEEELFNSQQMLRTVLDTIPQRVFWKNKESVYVGCNKSFAADWGLSSPDQIVGKATSDAVWSELVDRFRADDLEVMESRAPKLNYEEPRTAPDGSRQWLRTSKVPLFDHDQKVIGVLGTYEDITEQKKAQAALAEASNLLKTLLENIPDYIYFKDLKSRFVLVSKSFEKLFDVGNIAEVRGKTDFDYFLEEHARAAYEDEQEIMRTGKPIIGKVETESHPDGRVTQALTTKMAWRDAEGRIVGTFGISKDITALREAQAELAHERDLFRALLDGSPDRIYFKDMQSRFVRFSRSKAETSLPVVRAFYETAHPDIQPEELPEHLTSVEKFSGWLIGKTDFDTYNEAFAREAFEHEQEIIRTGNPIIGRLERLSRSDGQIQWGLITKMPWRDVNGNIIGTFGITRDITALKRAEAELEATHQRLVETSRLAGMAEVATDVLHNVGNVLNSINVSCSLTIDRVKASKISSLEKMAALMKENEDRLGEFFSSDPRGRQIPDYVAALAGHFTAEQKLLLEELEQLLKHIDHIKQIVAMQQAYAKVAGVVEIINPPQLVEDALQINAAALSRHDIRLERRFTPTPQILTERHKVLQILVNLIRNAKYALDDSKRPDKRLWLTVFQNGEGMIEIQVADNGIGIAPENLTRIFAHGFTTRSQGHGFGLHSSALAVREIGGSLRAQSEGLGKGATFILLLPLKPPAQSQPPQPDL